MQVIPDNLQITTGYHVFETPDDIIINSQMYDKFTMQPKDYCFWNTNYCLNNKNLLLHEVNILEYSWAKIAKEPDYQYYIQDNKDSDIFYFITEIDPTNQNQYVCKCKKTETSYEILNHISPDSGYRPFINWSGSYGDIASTFLHYKIIGQTSNFILLAQIASGRYYVQNNRNERDNEARGASLSYVVINKLDFSVKYLNRYIVYDYSVYFIESIDDYLYLYETYGQRSDNLGYQRILRYDLSTNTLIALYDKTCPCNNFIGISNIILFKDKYYTLTCADDNSYYAFNIFDINFQSNSVDFKQIILPNNQNFTYHKQINRNDYFDSHWIQIDLKNIDDTYIAITEHDTENKTHGYYAGGRSDGYNSAPWQYVAQTSHSSVGWHRHALFKYENNEWISKGIIEPEENNQHIYGVLYYDQYTPVFVMNNKVQIQRLDLENEQYEEVLEIPGTFYTVGLDSNNTLYLFDNNNKCTTYNTASSNQLEINFEKSQYKYNNQTINTYVTIYSKNLLNEYISSSVKITLSGNCQFTNGDKELYTNTDSNGPINIPVAITYGGKIYCYIEEV